jgi:hypothetical protein
MPQRGLRAVGETQHARDFAGHFAMNLRKRRQRGAHATLRGERLRPVGAVFEHRHAAADVIAEHVGKTGRVRGTAGPAQQRRFDHRAARGVVGTGRARELRGEPRRAQRVIGGLSHAEVADKGERLDRVEDAQCGARVWRR